MLYSLKKCLALLFFVNFININGGQMPKKPPVLIISEDLPYIKCDVCNKAAKSLYKVVESEKKQGKKLDEDDILSVVEKFCDTDSDYGNWISKLDIVEKGDALKIVEHTKEGKCNRECKTIAHSCDDSIGDADTDIGELLWKGDLKLSSFVNEVCYRLTNSCKKHSKKYVKGKRKDYKFVEMTEKDKEVLEMMKKMKGIPGMPGMEMYNREDMQNMRESMGMSPDDDNDDGNNAIKEENDRFEGKTKLGLLDTIIAALMDLWERLKRMVGYASKKNEL